MFDQFTTNTNGSTVTNYTYAGTRNNERTAAGSTSFLNGTLGVTQQTKSGAATSFIRDPDGTLISMRTSTGASYYYTTDAIGSTIMLTDSAQAKAVEYKYDSWGVQTSSTGTHAATNPWTYAGGYNDTTSNRIKFGARYYNPSRGRFTQPDPSNQEQNRYLYAGANPINNTDPTGLVCYSFNRDTPECGWYGPPAPEMTPSCKVDSIVFGLSFVASGGFSGWVTAAIGLGGFAGTLTACSGQFPEYSG